MSRHDRVLVDTRNDPEVAAAVLGTWAAGGVAVLLDSRETELHLRHAVDLVKPACAVADLEVPRGERQVELSARALPTDPASILFTSGSTGRPKAVTQTHGSLLRGCRGVASYLGLGAQDRIVCTIPWSFDYGYGQLLSTLVLGATHLLPEALAPTSICEAIERWRPTVLPGVPSVFSYLLSGMSPFAQTDISSVGTVTNTGGTIPRAVLEALLDRLGEGPELFLNYGLTESYRTSFLDPRLVRSHPDSIGRAIPGVDVVVLDEEGQVARPGVTGEIVHRGDYLFRGYWGDPDASARALRPDPLAPPELPNPPLVLFTGDLGWKDEQGLLYFGGRRDRQIKSMGVRVSPEEVEELLLASGLVREAAVFGVAHDLMGQQVWAAVVPAEECPELEVRLKQYARTVMTDFMTPRRYLVRDSLPRTRSGKVDHAALRDQKP